MPEPETGRDISRIFQLADEAGLAVILQNNKPAYIILPFSDYEKIIEARTGLISRTADEVISENAEALRELAR
ncbi:MAG: type II toxin-antitoxin system Phd/YefM family antitoxin [Deltaproteobacteria bacterium]|nr:type II toxin-antitoxin system Phd/YefM family antitoxin [Deltaproteobacteria bacterium]